MENQLVNMMGGFHTVEKCCVAKQLMNLSGITTYEYHVCNNMMQNLAGSGITNAKWDAACDQSRTPQSISLVLLWAEYVHTNAFNHSFTFLISKEIIPHLLIDLHNKFIFPPLYLCALHILSFSEKNRVKILIKK